jgi:hypothetical protein
MTDESKPKVVEQWMRNLCETIRLRHPMMYARTGPNVVAQDSGAHGGDEAEIYCYCAIIASAFARSRPAVAAGLLAEAAEAFEKYAGMLRELEEVYSGTSKAAPVFESLAIRLRAAAKGGA